MPSGRVLLLGDSMRVACQARVAALLSEDGLLAVGPEGSCGDSAAMAEGIEEWEEEFEPDLCCFACGPYAREALAWMASGRPGGGGAPEPVPMSRYQSNLLRIAEVMRRYCGQQTVFVNAAPVHASKFDAARSGGRGSEVGGGEALNRLIAQYDQAAAMLLGQLNVGVIDLHRELSRREDECFGADGVGLSAAGVELAANVVAQGVLGLVHA